MTAVAATGRGWLPGLPKTRHWILVVILVAVWCALWGDLSWANVGSGLVIASGLVVLGLRKRTVVDGLTSGQVRPWPLLKLIGLIAWDLARSTFQVVVEVLNRGEGNEAIIAVEVPPAARHHLLLLVVGITVTPGTAVVNTDLDRNILYLHILYHEKRDEVADHVVQLVELACNAFPHRNDVGEASRDGARP